MSEYITNPERPMRQTIHFLRSKHEESLKLNYSDRKLVTGFLKAALND